MENSGLFLNMAKRCFWVFFEVLMLLWFVFCVSAIVPKVLKMLVFSKFLGLFWGGFFLFIVFGRFGCFCVSCFWFSFWCWFCFCLFALFCFAVGCCCFCFCFFLFFFFVFFLCFVFFCFSFFVFCFLFFVFCFLFFWRV